MRDNIFRPWFLTRRGFTLVELAIVLAVAALLFAGLWRLMAGGSQQMRDQSAADQMRQLAVAVNGYLASPEGQAYIAQINGGTASATINAPLGLPTDPANCTGTMPVTNPVTTGFCNFLPQGFFSGTTNSYGQTYNIRIRKDSGEAGGTAARNYSFMIMTTGGDVIPDTSGGRITGMIGNDGGFIYTQDVCATALGATIANSACGAYGAWAQVVTDYGFAGGASGHIAARFSSISGTDANIWLARRPYQTAALTAGDTPEFHTLQADTFMDGTHNLTLNGSTIWGAPQTSANPSGAIMNLGQLSVGWPTGTTPTNTNMLTVSAPCDSSGGSGGCAYTAIQANGDIKVTGKLQAFYFIYESTSDERLKHDIKPLENSLENLSKIKALSFRLNSNNEKRMGVLSQDVEKVYPELIQDLGNGYKGVDYMGLIAPLIGAVQELKEENDELKKQLFEQKEAIKLLRKRVR